MDRKDSTPSIHNFKGSASGLNIAESCNTRSSKATSTEHSSSTSDQPTSRSKKSTKNYNVLCGWVSHPSSARNDMEPNTKSSQTSFSEDEEQNFKVKIEKI